MVLIQLFLKIIVLGSEIQLFLSIVVDKDFYILYKDLIVSENNKILKFRNLNIFNCKIFKKYF